MGGQHTHARTYIVILAPVCHIVPTVCVCDRARRVCVSMCRGNEARHDWQGTVGGQDGRGSTIQRQRRNHGWLYDLQLLERQREEQMREKQKERVRSQKSRQSMTEKETNERKKKRPTERQISEEETNRETEKCEKGDRERVRETRDEGKREKEMREREKRQDIDRQISEKEINKETGSER